MNAERLLLRIRGRVQGVWYRASARERAQQAAEGGHVGLQDSGARRDAREAEGAREGVHERGGDRVERRGKAARPRPARRPALRLLVRHERDELRDAHKPADVARREEQHERGAVAARRRARDGVECGEEGGDEHDAPAEGELPQRNVHVPARCGVVGHWHLCAGIYLLARPPVGRVVVT